MYVSTDGILKFFSEILGGGNSGGCEAVVSGKGGCCCCCCVPFTLNFCKSKLELRV